MEVLFSKTRLQHLGRFVPSCIVVGSAKIEFLKYFQQYEVPTERQRRMSNVLGFPQSERLHTSMRKRRESQLIRGGDLTGWVPVEDQWTTISELSVFTQKSVPVEMRDE